jgi:membrane fusion protein (multidrug efflux system)
VEAGAVLARIDPRDYQIALDQAGAQVAQARGSIANIKAQLAAQEALIAEERAQREQAAARVQFAQEEDQRYETLAKRGAGSLQKAQQTRSDLTQRQAGLAAAAAAVGVAQRQADVLRAQLESADANLAAAEAARRQAELNLSYTVIIAAQSGRVAELSAARGEFVQPGQALMAFVPDKIWVTANFKETEITNMRPGQPVDIEVDAYPNFKFTGRVQSIQAGSGAAFSLLPAENATGNFVKVTQRVPVKIVFDKIPSDIVLGPGMSVVPEVKVR